MHSNESVGLESWSEVSENPAYEVSNQGSVRRIDTGRLMALTPRRNGYVSVSLASASGKRRFYVHRLVAKAFLGVDPLGQQINHLNFCRHDNRAENLEVVTCLENHRHSQAAGRFVGRGRAVPRGDASPHSKLNSGQVAEIRRRVADGALKAHLAREYGVTKTQVANIVNGISWR